MDDLGRIRENFDNVFRWRKVSAGRTRRHRGPHPARRHRSLEAPALNGDKFIMKCVKNIRHIDHMNTDFKEYDMKML